MKKGRAETRAQRTAKQRAEIVKQRAANSGQTICYVGYRRRLTERRRGAGKGRGERSARERARESHHQNLNSGCRGEAPRRRLALRGIEATLSKRRRGKAVQASRELLMGLCIEDRSRFFSFCCSAPSSLMANEDFPFSSSSLLMALSKESYEWVFVVDGQAFLKRVDFLGPRESKLFL